MKRRIGFKATPMPKNWVRALYIILKRKLRRIDHDLLIAFVAVLILILQMFIIVTAVKGQERGVSRVYGRVLDEKGDPLPGASLKLKSTDRTTTSGTAGEFELLNFLPNDILIISFVGYKTREVELAGKPMPLEVVMIPDAVAMREVVISTGYQEIPLERATGSFVHLNKEILNRRVSTSLLERLEGVSSGLVFNRNTLTPNERLGISIRGRSSIDAGVNPDPLIVLDNFPYEGDIDNINPDDVESITVLKDAAAASIWGARAGNGVIVITTKKGRFNTPLLIEANTNIRVGAKPDLFYSPDFISSADFVEAERFLFNKGFYDADINNTISRPALSPVVDILAKQRAGTIPAIDAEARLNELKGMDVRQDFSQYIYRPAVNQQYSMSLKGGGVKHAFKLSAGYDRNQENVVGNGYSRITLNSQNTFHPFKRLELAASLNYVQTNRTDNGDGSAFGSIVTGGKYTMLPYMRLADANGNPLSVTKDYNTDFIQSSAALGFYDWQYRPLEEVFLADRTTAVNDLLVKAGVKYRFSSFLNAAVDYAFERQATHSKDYRSKDTYYARNLMNQYAQRDPATGAFLYPFPEGGVLNLGNGTLNVHNLRTQVNFDRNFGSRHAVNALAGAELRERTSGGYSRTSYGYDDELGTAVTNVNYAVSYPRNPSGSALIPAPAASVNGSTNRFVSYYGNAGYTYNDRYTLTLSGRKDGANIFGVRTNDRITPLWSAGLAWDINREPFYKLAFLPFLKLRATYGYSGNVYNSSAYLTAQYFSGSLTGNRYAIITGAPNPELSWERVRNVNLGLDFALNRKTVSGSVEGYVKTGMDLIQNTPLAPSSGYYSYKGNSASVRTTGLDITLNTRNIDRPTFKWQSAILMSLQKDQVLRYDDAYTTRQLVGSSISPGTAEAGGLFALVGKPLFGIYSYPWAGFDPQTGDPQGYLNGQLSKDYLAIINNASSENLVFHGSSRPGVFGAVRNTFSVKRFEVSANITYKFDYYFRKNTGSASYQDVLNNNGLHADFSRRWQQPGDEAFATLPSVVYPNDNNRSAFFKASEFNVEKGDHIRLQDIRISYNRTINRKSSAPVNTTVYFYAANLGLLWKANSAGLDPDYLTRFSYPDPRSVAVGIKTTF